MAGQNQWRIHQKEVKLWNQDQVHLSPSVLHIFLLYRYGGISFGERNDLVLVNGSEVDSIFQQLAEAANGQDQLQRQNLSLPKLLMDLENLIDNLASKRNAKVCTIYQAP